MTTMTEKWLPVVGWEGAYEVSDQGRVRSIERTAPNGGGRTYVVPGKMLSPRSQAHGYLCVSLRRGKQYRKVASVHRLVAMAFIQNPRQSPNVNHIDCNPANNLVGNLEWCTQAENLEHMAKLGRASRHATGKRPSCALLTNAQVSQMRQWYSKGGITHAGLALQYEVSKKTVTNILNGKTYRDVL